MPESEDVPERKDIPIRTRLLLHAVLTTGIALVLAGATAIYMGDRAARRDLRSSNWTPYVASFDYTILGDFFDLQLFHAIWRLRSGVDSQSVVWGPLYCLLPDQRG